MTRVYHLVSTLGPTGVGKHVALVVPRLPERFAQAVGLLGSGEPFAAAIPPRIPLQRLKLRHRFDVPALWAIRREIAALRPDVVHAWGADAVRTARFLMLPRIGLNPAPKFVLSPTVPPVVAAAEPPNTDIRSEFGLPPNARLIVSVGGFDASGAAKTAAWAFDVLRHTAADIHLVLVGDGPTRPAVEQFIRTLAYDDLRVHFTGLRADVPAVLARAAVMWSLVERRGANAVLEAMAAGVPVVAVANPDLAAVLRDGATGRFVAAGDKARLAALTSELLASPPAATALGAAGRARALSQFPVGPVVDGWALVYDG